MTCTPANVTFSTGTVSSPNFTSMIWGSGTQTAKLTMSGLTIGTPYLLKFTPTVTGQAPVITASTGVGSYSTIPAVVTATVVNVKFIPSAVSAVFVFSNTTTSTWSTASTTCYALTPTVAKYDSGQNASVAWVTQYSANPTVGTGYTLRNKILNFGVAGAAGTVTFDFMTSNDKPLLLLNANQGVAIYLNAEAVPSGGTISWDAEWEEISN